MSALRDFDPYTNEETGGFTHFEIEFKATQRPGPEVLLELWVWKAGTKKPLEPQFFILDGVAPFDEAAPHTSGLAGINFWWHSGNRLRLYTFCIDRDPNPVPFDDSFRRGDTNADGRLNVADAIFTLTYLFAEGPPPSCEDAADANDDGAIDIADAIAVLSHLFGGAGPLPQPLEEPFGVCGQDPTADEMGCADYESCHAPWQQRDSY